MSEQGTWHNSPGLNDLVAERDRLKAENEILIWNLAGCSTYALGYGINEDHDKTMARPALEDCRKMALQNQRLREALEHIQKKRHSGSAWEQEALDKFIEQALAEGL